MTIYSKHLLKKYIKHDKNRKNSGIVHAVGHAGRQLPERKHCRANATEAQACTVRAVSYTIDGVEHLTVLHCDEEWDAFLSWMLALSKEGRQVYFRNLNATGTTAQTKEAIV